MRMFTADLTDPRKQVNPHDGSEDSVLQEIGAGELTRPCQAVWRPCAWFAFLPLIDTATQVTAYQLFVGIDTSLGGIIPHVAHPAQGGAGVDSQGQEMGHGWLSLAAEHPTGAMLA